MLLGELLLAGESQRPLGSLCMIRFYSCLSNTAEFDTCCFRSIRDDSLSIRTLDLFYGKDQRAGRKCLTVVEEASDVAHAGDIPTPRWFVQPIDGQQVAPGVVRYIRSPTLWIDVDVGAASVHICGDQYLVERQALSVVRDQVIGRQAQAAGAVFLHASAVASNRATLVFLGQSGAGKTSLMLRYLASGWSAVGTDRVALARSPTGITAHPVPDRLCLRKDQMAKWNLVAAERLGERYLVETGDIARSMDPHRSPVTVIRIRRGLRTSISPTVLEPIDLVPLLRDGDLSSSHPFYLDLGRPLRSAAARLAGLGRIEAHDLVVGQDDHERAMEVIAATAFES